MPTETQLPELNRPLPGFEVVIWDGEYAEELLQRWFPVQFNSIDFVLE